MAKIHLLLYRNWDIYISNESGRFIIENDAAESEIQKPSLDAAKAFVDDFIKRNAVFEPFLVEKVDRDGMLDDWRKEGPRKVLGIRKDGRFILENSKGEKEQLGENYTDGWALFNPENTAIRAEIEAIEAELAEAGKPYKQRIKAAKNRLRITTLKQHQLATDYSAFIEKKDRYRFGAE